MSESHRRPSVSAVVVTYDSARHISSCLAGLREALQQPGDEVLVIDNDSADDTLDVVARGGYDVTVVRMPHNMGFAAGVNKGIASSHGDCVLVVNPDLVIGPDCVNTLARFLAAHEGVGAAGPLLRDASGIIVPSRRRFPTVRGILTNRFSLLRRLMGEKARSRYLMLDISIDVPCEVDWLSGGCLMLKRSALVDVGVFDDRFFLYFEDTDWCYRARQQGWKVYYLPQCSAVHDAQRESARGLNRWFVLHVRSMLRYYAKHGLRI